MPRGRLYSPELVIDNRPLRIRTVGGVEGADGEPSPLSDSQVRPALELSKPKQIYFYKSAAIARGVSEQDVLVIPIRVRDRVRPL